MSNEKIKPKLNGTAETMLQCFYARVQIPAHLTTHSAKS